MDSGTLIYPNMKRAPQFEKWKVALLIFVLCGASENFSQSFRDTDLPSELKGDFEIPLQKLLL